jgi:hypothetical protein
MSTYDQSKGGQVPPYVELAVHYKAEIDATAAERDRLKDEAAKAHELRNQIAIENKRLFSQLSALQAEAAMYRSEHEGMRQSLVALSKAPYPATAAELQSWARVQLQEITLASSAAKGEQEKCGTCGGKGYVYEGEAITGRGPDDVFPEKVACPDCATPEQECAHCGHPAHERYCTADECQCAFFATPERKP